MTEQNKEQQESTAHVEHSRKPAQASQTLPGSIRTTSQMSNVQLQRSLPNSSDGPRFVDGKPARKTKPSFDAYIDYHYWMVNQYSRSPGPIYNVMDALRKNIYPAEHVRPFAKDDRVKHFVWHTPSLGVGAYKPPEMPPNALEEPKYSVPKDKRNTGMINITNYQGQFKDPFDPAMLSTVERAANIGFSKDDRLKHFVTHTPSPGAGAYKPPDKMPDALEDPRYSMPKGERNTGMINTTNYKGQFKDPQNITLLSTSTAPVIPAFSKDDRVKHFVTHTPSLGVGAYNPPALVGVHPSNKSGGTFSLAVRDPSEIFFM
ncbi:MAG: hypothetical protein EZS28_005020 [Streblomastix strix]|uniref:Uncharacterized protein n=1 Tax=Streblomastix strix TaxID=222440 RepID=A0A5J4WWN1_9EUKA|nr:MAG: hypothetical protein EZS28_005020 [Streblomastix strix]